MKENNNVEMVKAIIPSDINSLIPAEEQAVDEANLLVENQLPEVEVVTPSKDMSAMVPDAEQGIQVTEVHEYDAIIEQGYLTPAAGLACLKTNTQCNEHIFAAVRIDAKGKRTVEFCQHYSDGSFSPLVEVRQSDLFYVNSFSFDSKNVKSTRLRAKVNKIMDKVTEDYMNILSCNECLNIVDILKTLVVALPNLPEYAEEEKQLTPQEFYKQLIAAKDGDCIATGEYLPPIMCIDTYKSYYPFTTSEIIELARRMGLKKGELLMRLKRYNLLYLTASSNGYQTKIRLGIDPETGKELFQGLYCIYNMDYISAQINKSSVLTQSTKDKSTEG